VKITRITLTQKDLEYLLGGSLLHHEVRIGKKIRIIEIAVTHPVVLEMLDSAKSEREFPLPPKEYYEEKDSEPALKAVTREQCDCETWCKVREEEAERIAEPDTRSPEQAKAEETDVFKRQKLINDHHDNRMHGLCVHGEPRGFCTKGGYTRATDVQGLLW
jgi:hypothetical protein